EGAVGIAIDDATGSLIITGSDGVKLIERAPVAWQTYGDAMQTPISVGYQLNTDGMAQFVVGAYDRALPLVIDPGLDYSTYLGGGGTDCGAGVAVDSSGNAYVTGYTFGSFPTTSGTYQTAYGGGSSDVFVSKLNAAGSALVYSTYLGGSGGDLGSAIAVD